MPNLQITNFRIGRTTDAPPNNTFVSCVFNVTWSREELAANEVYVLRAYLIEWDDDKDVFRIESDGQMVLQEEKGNADEYWRIAEHTLRPSDGTKFPIDAVGSYSEQESGEGEYYIRGTLAPQQNHVVAAITPDIVIELDPA